MCALLSVAMEETCEAEVRVCVGDVMMFRNEDY